MDKKIYAQITLTTGDKINLELFAKKAPITVANFVSLAKQGYYENTIFHRIIKDFMIQTGGYYLKDEYLEALPNVDEIQGEFFENGFTKNDIKHDLGVISMARKSDFNSASSQFFLCSARSEHLDGSYAAFGKTTDTKSNEVILKISNYQTYNIGYGFTDFPCEIIGISKIRIGEDRYE